MVMGFYQGGLEDERPVGGKDQIWPIDQEALIRAGERIFNVKRIHNVRLGITRKDDLLPPAL